MYLIIILSGSIVLSSGPHIPILLLLLHGFSLYRSFSVEQDTILILVTVIIAPLAWGTVLPQVFAGTLVLPGLPLLISKLRDLAPKMEIPPHKQGWRTTNTSNAIISIIVIAGILGFVLKDLALIGTASMLFLFILSLCSYSLFQFRGIGISIEDRSFQIMSGKRFTGKLQLYNHSTAKWYISLTTQDPHFRASITNPLMHSRSENQIDVNMETSLAGPVEPSIYITRQDHLGLLWHGEIMQPVTIQVIPKAQYATWLAQRYLDQAGTDGYTDMAPMTANNRGVEFSSLRPYHPGDRLRDVDWKHTAKSRETIVREHRDPQAGATVLLVNIVAENPDQADWISYQLVMSALSAAKANVPVAFALYDQTTVVFSSTYLNPLEAVQQSMQLIDQVTIQTGNKRLLSPSNPSYLHRTSQTLSTNSNLERNSNLKKLIDIELTALERNALLHPVNEALKVALALSAVKPTISVISHQNHDVNTLSFVLSKFRNYSHSIIDLQTEDFQGALRAQA